MITNLTIFTSAICNLNCSYCYVKKTKALKDYDELVVNAILNNEYIKRFIKDFPDSVNSLETLEFWGAEPTVHLDLISNKLKDYKAAFPNLHNISMSSNYTLPNFINQIECLINAMGEIKDTNWNFHLQCSIDGSKEITDNNRGIGTTDKIIDNINKLKNLSIPNNVMLTVANKSTISGEQFDELSDINKVSEHIGFLKNIFDYKDKNKNFWVTAPTCAEPFYYTQEDGIKFAKVIDNFATLSLATNKTYIPYIRNRKIILSEYIKGGYCGQCEQCITMLPNNMYASCHRCGFDIIPEHYDMKKEEYKKMFDIDLDEHSNWIKDINGYNQLQYNMYTFYDTRSKNTFSQLYNISKLLLAIGEISSQYYNDKLLKKHLMLFMNFTKCMQTNKELTGSCFCNSSFFIPLFFNGAISKMYDYLKNKNLIDEQELDCLND